MPFQIISAAAGAAAAAGSTRREVPIATRLAASGGLASNGTDMGETTRYRIKVLKTALGARLVYTNWAANQAGFNDVIVRASIELLSGQFIPVRFNGARDVTIGPFGTVTSDPIGYPLVGGSEYWVRTGIRVLNAGEKWWRTGATYISGEGTNIAATFTDLTTSGTVPSTVTNAYRPAALIAEQATPPAVVAIVGDSIAELSNDNQQLMSGLGFAERSIADAGLLPLKIAVSGETAGNLTGAAELPRLALLRYATHAIVNYGSNSLPGSTLASLQAVNLSLFGRIAGVVKAYGVTLLPRTGIGATQETVRANYNDWVRAGAPIDPTTKAAVAVGTAGALLAGSTGHPMSGYFELADAVEEGRNTNVFKTSVPNDGVHPAVAGHELLKGVLDARIAASVFA